MLPAPLNAIPLAFTVLHYLFLLPLLLDSSNDQHIGLDENMSIGYDASNRSISLAGTVSDLVAGYAPASISLVNI